MGYRYPWYGHPERIPVLYLQKRMNDAPYSDRFAREYTQVEEISKEYSRRPRALGIQNLLLSRASWPSTVSFSIRMPIIVSRTSSHF